MAINVKKMPPINSHFQAINRKTNKINEGIKCMKKSPSCCQMVSSGEKASSANMLTNRIDKMQIIRGAQ